MIKKIFKFIGVFLLVLLVLYLGAEAGFQVKHRIEVWKADKASEAFNKAIEEMFKADTYGGKTPEETFNLFVDALKKEDVDLAVKYIVLDIERRQRYYDEFNEMKKNGKLKEYGEKLPKWEEFKQIKDDYNDWRSRAEIKHFLYYSETRTVDLPDGAGGYIKTVLPPGNYTDYRIVFVKNSNNVWKIESF
jgi:hypothetical protein